MREETTLHHREGLKQSRVEAIVAQMAGLVLDIRNRGSDSPAIEKAVRGCLAGLTPFLQQNGSLALIVQEEALVFADRVVYSCADKRDSLAFALFRDGIRNLTLEVGLTKEELKDFLCAVNEAFGADPTGSDLVTMLWDRDLDHITFRSVDTHLGKDIGRKINDLIGRCAEAHRRWEPGSVDPGPGFFLSDLGISPPADIRGRASGSDTVSEPDLRALALEALDEDEQALIKECSEICLEIIHAAGDDDLFRGVVWFLGKACEWLVASGDFAWASLIIVKLRDHASDNDTPADKAAVIDDVISRLGEKQKIMLINDHLKELTESRFQEIYGYLTLMAPVAVGPLCEMLAYESERSVRHLLCRALSIIGRDDMSQMARYIKDGRWYVARNMVMILGMMEAPDAIPILTHALSNPEPRVRKELARALGKIRSPEGLALLGSLFDDEDKRVRMASIRAAREIGGDSAIEVLRSTISDKSFRKRPIDERKEMMIAFGSLGRESFDLLRAVLEGKVHRWDRKTQACAAYGLAQMGDQDAAALLKGTIEKGSGSVRYAAAEAYAGIQGIPDTGVADDE